MGFAPAATARPILKGLRPLDPRPLLPERPHTRMWRERVGLFRHVEGGMLFADAFRHPSANAAPTCVRPRHRRTYASFTAGVGSRRPDVATPVNAANSGNGLTHSSSGRSLRGIAAPLRRSPFPQVRA